MRKPKIVFDFLRASNPNLETQAGTILAAMTNNQYFVNPTPSLGDVNAALQQFAAALYASQSGSKFYIEQRKEARLKLELELKLKRLANYVMPIAGDSRPIMVSSGFIVNSETKNVTVLGALENFAVTPGANSGEAMLSVNPVDNKESYIFYYTLAGTDNIIWEHEPGNLPWFLLKGLQPLKPYLFKIKVTGNKNQSAETEIITKIIL